ncbi:hypothetical protein [Pseudomonas sp. CCI3.1]|uniref:hypothetical protein n=1 Tax=Pseudomonas sp. CCI3.1 TaxID=3048618 RepID=UPI002AB4DB52|nr:MULTISPECIES: hypothetical protein [unclassified Pseudomonas]MDY7584315.1 hypothetical protein [Pseudomonas sp. CCI3.1]MEB0065593.1 hypothetical protein [Pseudomonas sp. CCI3.1]MEB0071201.1 hypothetical protein [Pseudomonas sp. CCI1.4]
MSLIGGSTRWVLFLSTSAPDAETRHILDLAYGVLCLERAGVKMADIAIYIDGADRVSIDNFIRSGTASAFVVKESKDFFVDQANNTYENVVMFVTGHGGPQGIDAVAPITPYTLLKCLKSSPNLQTAVVYLGQCYAGIFNYIGAGRKQTIDGKVDPDVIFIGATNLHESLSASTMEPFLTGPVSWLANLFLLFAFKWFSKPVDIDGDGKYTITDSYKYAGVFSNAINKDKKASALAKSVDLQSAWTAARAVNKATPNIQAQLAEDAAFTCYSELLGLLYIHQECWILNAIPSQSIEV